MKKQIFYIALYATIVQIESSNYDSNQKKIKDLQSEILSINTSFLSEQKWLFYKLKYLPSCFINQKDICNEIIQKRILHSQNLRKLTDEIYKLEKESTL